MKKSFKITIAVAIFAIFSLFSCGKKDSKEIEPVATPTTEEPYEEHPIETPVATNDLHIESNDQMQYSVNELRASCRENYPHVKACRQDGKNRNGT